MKNSNPEPLHEEMTLKEICERFFIDAELVIQLVDYGIVEPRGSDCGSWTFSSRSYLRIRKALRLQRDFSLNHPGVALAIELLDKLDSANREIQHLRRRLKSDDIIDVS